MIEINLLPKELRKKKQAFKMPDLSFAFMPAVIGAVVVLVVIQAGMMLTVNIKRSALEKMEKEWIGLAPQVKELSDLKKEVTEFKAKIKSIDELMVKRVLWSRKLNSLSDSMIPGIWLTKLGLSEKRIISRPAKPRKRGRPSEKQPREVAAEAVITKVLNIEGFASSEYGDETATVGRFINSLKRNKDFFEDFSQVELDQMERKRIEDLELMNFRINCYFEEDAI